MAAFSSFEFDSIFLPNSPINKMCGSLEEITNTPCFQFYEPENLHNLDNYTSNIVSTLLSDNEPSFSHGTNKSVSMDSSSITDTTPTSFMGKKKRKTRVASSSNFAQSKDTGDQVKGKKAKKCKDDEEEEKKTSRKEKKIINEKKGEEKAPIGYIHVRARRGQATDSHSLAERVRRERISERMKLLQALVPGCDKVTGKALMLDEIINYVQSLQNQVEFLSMKLASTTPMLYSFGMDLESFMDRAGQNNLRSLASAATHGGNYPLVDNSYSPADQLGQEPNNFSQGNWWGVDEQRQKALNQPAGISYNLCS